MRREIQDRFTALPVSRQRKYQLRRRAEGRCTKCGAPAPAGMSLCLPHAVESRERQRVRQGTVRTYQSKTRRLEAAAK